MNQSSHDKAGVFEDTIKVDDMFSPTHELESGTSDPGSTPLSVQGRLKAHVQLWERINAPLSSLNASGRVTRFLSTLLLKRQRLRIIRLL